MKVLLLRFDAPLMSFGGVMVDQKGPTDRFPGRSMLAGLFGNALGYRHGDAPELEALQSRIEYAARWDVAPELLVDYHTVDLGLPGMREPGWTTRGVPEHRSGGTARFETHQRYRHYWANGVLTLAVTVLEPEKPTVNDLAAAIREPARPLYIGRKICLPSLPILLDIVDGPDLLDIVRRFPLAKRSGMQTEHKIEACWTIGAGISDQSRQVVVYDRRDWQNQVHSGQGARHEGLIEVSRQ